MLRALFEILNINRSKNTFTSVDKEIHSHFNTAP